MLLTFYKAEKKMKILIVKVLSAVKQPVKAEEQMSCAKVL